MLENQKEILNNFLKKALKRLGYMTFFSYLYI
mgnify:CR=1 FL=1